MRGRVLALDDLKRSKPAAAAVRLGDGNRRAAWVVLIRGSVPYEASSQAQHNRHALFGDVSIVELIALNQRVRGDDTTSSSRGNAKCMHRLQRKEGLEQTAPLR